MSMFDLLLNTFFTNLTQNYQYDVNVLRNEWNKVNQNFVQKIEENPSQSQTSSSIVNTTITGCKYVAQRGAKANQMCNAKVKSGGYIVCTLHVKYESKCRAKESQQPTPPHRDEPQLVNKSRAKILTPQQQRVLEIQQKRIINTCKTKEDEERCINMDALSVLDINRLCDEHLPSDPNFYKHRSQLFSEEIFADKRDRLIQCFLSSGQPIKYTIPKFKNIEYPSKDIITVRTKTHGKIMNLVKYKLTDLWVDKNTRSIVRSPEDPTVIGHICIRFEQPVYAIDEWIFDIVKCNSFDYDVTKLDDTGRRSYNTYQKALAEHKKCEEMRKEAKTIPPYLTFEEELPDE